MNKVKDRNTEIIRYNLAGIVMNLLLALFKLIAGYSINAHAVMPDVLGVSNVVLHNYGQNQYVGSMDVEVDASMRAGGISKLSRRIIRAAEGLGVTLTSVGISAANTDDPESIRMWDSIIGLAARHEGIKRVYSFTYDEKDKVVSFCLVPDYSFRKKNRDIKEFRTELSELYPEIKADIYTGIDM